MARLLSKCPKCNEVNEVENTIYMRLDLGARVICKKCDSVFNARLSKNDVETLFKPGNIDPVVPGEEDYFLESGLYPK